MPSSYHLPRGDAFLDSISAQASSWASSHSFALMTSRRVQARVPSSPNVAYPRSRSL